MRRPAAIAAAAALAAASSVAIATAQAAYDPQFDVRVDPATPAAPAALTATLTQAPGETATQTERVRFPADFRFNPGLHVSRCGASDEQAGHCPDSSRIGAAEASTLFGDFAGGVYLTSDFRFVVFLRGFAGLVQQEVSGYMLLQPDGSVVSVLDNLPNVPTTLGRVSFDGGSRSLFLTPRACGAYFLDAQFTSHAGDQVSRRAPIRIAGCDSAPRFEEAAVSPQTLRTGRRSVRLSWRLSDAGSATLIEVQRIVAAGRFERWRRVLRVRASANAGLNRLHLDLRRLRPARYRVVLTSVSAGGREVDIAWLSFRIVRRRAA